MTESRNQFEPENAEQQEVKTSVRPFETIREHAIAEIGQIYALSFEDAKAKAQEIATEKGINNFRLVVCLQAETGEFIKEPDEAEWSRICEEYEDDEDYATPIAFLVD